MNKQTYELLKKIMLMQDTPHSIDELSSTFSVSKRTIYNYWEEISDYLMKLNLSSLYLFDGKYFRFAGSQKEKDYILDSMNAMNFYEYRLANDERRKIMITMLVCSDIPIKNESFQEVLCVSRNTIINDLQLIRQQLENQNIQISKTTHDGLFLNGTEANRRTLLIKTLEENDWFNDYFLNRPVNPCVVYLINLLKLNRYRKLAEIHLKKAEEQLSLRLSDADFYRILLILLVQISRIQAKHRISLSDLSSLPQHASIHFAKAVFNQLKDEIEINQGEIAFFDQAIQFLHLSLKKTTVYNDSFFFSLTIKEFLQKISFYYKIDFLSDALLVEYLTAHIAACYHRINQGMPLDNPYLIETKTRYTKDFECLKRNIYILENGLNISLNDNEIAYILMHILASVERGKFNQYVPNILITCSVGMATGNFLAMQIGKHFQVNIVDICAVHKTAELVKTKNIDLIISTVHCEPTYVPSITVNVVLTEKDLVLIRKTLSDLEGTQSEVLAEEHGDTALTPPLFTPLEQNTFLHLFSVDRIVLNKEVMDWKEGIIAAGELLLWQKKITVNYLQQMIDLVIKYGPYIIIAQGVALAHASPLDGVIEAGIAIIRLKQPVNFEQHKYNPVSTILACAMYDTPEHANILIQLMTLLRRPDFNQMMLQARSAQEVLDYFAKRILSE